MGLFDKKICDICGEKIGLLGNRKLDDGNLCKDCAKKLSPWFEERAIRKALEILSREAGERDRGFILMVEGSQIDLRAHDNDAEGVLAEMRDFDRAVAAAMDFADRHPGTLVVVTADHETGGLSIPSADVDFEHEEAGIEYRFSTGGHTAAMVPVYLYGTGAERINGVLDNTELALRLAGTLGLR